MLTLLRGVLNTYMKTVDPTLSLHDNFSKFAIALYKKHPWIDFTFQKTFKTLKNRYGNKLFWTSTPVEFVIN